MSLISDIPDYLSAAALCGTALLTPLYLSQHRDVVRLRELKEREPDHPVRDLAASEALMDRAEAELEDTLAEAGLATGEAGELIQPTPIPLSERVGTGLTPIPPPTRITSERPALEQLTMEREALAPHPRWRRFAARISQPRILALLALAALAIGVAALFASGKLLPGNEPGKVSPKPGAIVPADVNVAVLNGTSRPGLAGRVGDDVQRSGFQLGSVTNSRKQYQQTVVMYGQGQQEAATRVARVLGVRPVQPIDAQTRSLAPNADVVVIAGVDRAKP
jgi:LytR cell envelope-related transcriptional attenuator